MAAVQRPVTDAALGEGASAAAWKDIPSWVLVATEDRDIPARTQVFLAEHANATVLSLTSSHAVSVSRPVASRIHGPPSGGRNGQPGGYSAACDPLLGR